jgi:hypothetical protein
MEDKLRKCYEVTSELFIAALHSIPGHIVIFFCTLVAILNYDLKIICFTAQADPVFSLLNEIIFIILCLEFLILVLFNKNYIGSFFFYLDLLAVLSMIPETDFIMKNMLSSDDDDKHASLDSTHHLMKASHASQAGAKY